MLLSRLLWVVVTMLSDSGYTPTTDEVRARYDADEFGYSASLGDPCPEFDRWLEKHDKEVRAEAWDEGNAEPRSGLPRCPVCDDRTVSLHNRGDHSEWKHDDDGTLICGGSLTKAVWKDHNPYRAISEIVEGNK